MSWIKSTALVTTFALSTLSAGCLSTTHEIPHGALVALANTPPEQRGQHVRVIQQMAGAEDPPAAPGVGVQTVIVVPVGGGERHYDDGRGGYGGRGGAGGGGGGGYGGGGYSGAKAAKDDAKGWIVLATLVALGFAFTEGARYDGWVQLNPMHPVHLYGPNGEHVWVPLAQIDPQTAAWATRAYVRPSEGPWNELGRAPLDRVGMTYTLTFGEAQIPSSVDTGNTKDLGFMAHMEIGGFPNPSFGILADIGLGWRDDLLGNTIVDGRYALEFQVLPLTAAFLHAGAYGEIGWASHVEDTPGSRDTAGVLAAGGGIAQIELTTRLTLTGRFGITALHGTTASEFGLGLSIY